MEIVLKRIYGQMGTNGEFYYNEDVICKSIELPWLDNKRQKSCIPEGRYRLTRRYSAKYTWHYEIHGVPNRSSILIHPANYALKELQGCIAPVTHYTKAGEGTESRLAMKRLKQLLDPPLLAGKSVFLNIKKHLL